MLRVDIMRGMKKKVYLQPLSDWARASPQSSP